MQCAAVLRAEHLPADGAEFTLFVFFRCSLPLQISASKTGAHTVSGQLSNRIAPSPWGRFLLVLGVAVIAAQLYAMAGVAGQQVHRAQLRDSLASQTSKATANCVRNFSSAALAQACISSFTVASAP